ncbi:SufD family Fe-S cluster assembly protein [Candidatus Peregrinibacteria bacterium]|nr:SufD family Fe-S cluster assembly protein [Candidatus Peregrinibacteria bacterium]
MSIIQEQKELMTVKAGEDKLVFVEEILDGTVVIEAGAKLTYVFLGLKGWEEMRKLKFEFMGSDSELSFLGFIVGSGKEQFPFETISGHRVPQTKGHFYLKAAMYGESNMDYTGTLVIDKSGPLADVYLESKTLLLSERARAKSVPALEIEADDVVAGHAATIGKIDKELLFYLKSRGISAEEAEKMLIGGFFESQLEMIADEQMREDVRRKIIEALPFERMHDETL